MCHKLREILSEFLPGSRKLTQLDKQSHTMPGMTTGETISSWRKIMEIYINNINILFLLINNYMYPFLYESSMARTGST